MNLARRGLCFAAMVIVGTGCSAGETGFPEATTTTGPALDTQVREIASDWYGQARVGGVVAVVGTPDGQVHIASIGEAASGVAASPDDVIRVGSITKTFTAALVLRLTSQGLVDLDAPVARYLPDLDLPPVTVRNLLDHTSGITDPEPHDLIAAFVANPGHRYAPDELIALAHLPPIGSDGAAFAYANANYHLASLVIEAVTGRPFGEVLRDEVFAIAGLEHTYLVGFEPVDEPIVPGNADLDGDGAEDSLAETPYLAVDTYGWSAGAIATTATDLVTFARALFDGTLLDDSALAEMTDRSTSGEYALGLVPLDQAGWGHNGGAPGYHAVFLHQPDTGVTAALFTNCPSCAEGTDDTWEVVADLLASGNG